MRCVSDKIMGDAMISKTCALFLSDADIKPGHVQGGGYLTDKGTHVVHLARKHDYRNYRALKMSGTSAKEAAIRRNARASRACLMVKYNWLHYHEYQTGKNRLILLNRTAPVTVLMAIASRNFRLLDIIDTSHLKPFWLVRSNPLFVSAKNVRKTITVDRFGSYSLRKVEVPAIEFTTVDDWSRSNWGYWDRETGYVSSMSDPDPRQKHEPGD